jgi:hypothetical protein
VRSQVVTALWDVSIAEHSGRQVALSALPCRCRANHPCRIPWITAVIHELVPSSAPTATPSRHKADFMDNRDYPCFSPYGNADPVPPRSVGHGAIICYSSDSSR